MVDGGDSCSGIEKYFNVTTPAEVMQQKKKQKA